MVEKNAMSTTQITGDQFVEYQQLLKFFDITADLLCIAGFDGYFKKINPAVSKLLEYSEQELLSRPINDFVYQEDKLKTIDSRNFVYEGSALLNFENRYLTKSGQIVWLYWTSIPDTEAQLVFAIAKNITTKKLAEDSQRTFQAELTKINDDLKRFSQTTSHDLRSPVNNLLIISNLLNSADISDPKTQELIKHLKSTSENLYATVNNFVDVMIKNERLNTTIEQLDFEEVLSVVTSRISSLIKNSGAQILVDVTAVSKINFDRRYLESIFLNLISNAIKYAHPDRTPVIRITSSIEDGIKCLSFADNGLGLDMQVVKDKIFKPNQIFHDHADSKGLGLHLVHQQVTALGARITVQSTLDSGTTFSIFFED